MLYSFGHEPLVVTSAKFKVGTPQLSVAVADPVFGGSVLAVHCIVTFAGQVMVGSCASFTVTLCTQLLVLPLLSVTVQVTRFSPF